MGSLFSSRFNPATDLPSLKGKVIIVTGGNTGIGYATILHLARKGAKVYMAARNESKATKAIAQMKADGLGPGNGQVIWHKLDLSDPRNAKRAAEEFRERESKLDILINNAALLMVPYTISPDGVQDGVLVNHIGPFVFTHHLLPLLKETASAPGSDVRIVNVASIGHRFVDAKVRFENLKDFNVEFASAFYPSLSRYGFTKLMNILWTRELQKRLDSEGVPIITLSVHPGSVNTFADRLPRFRTVGKIILSLFFKTWAQGAYNSVIGAALPAVREKPEKYKAAYIEGDYGKVVKASELARNDEISTGLWKITEAFVRSLDLY